MGEAGEANGDRGHRLDDLGTRFGRGVLCGSFVDEIRLLAGPEVEDGEQPRRDLLRRGRLQDARLQGGQLGVGVCGGCRPMPRGTRGGPDDVRQRVRWVPIGSAVDVAA